MIADQMKKRTPVEFNERHLDEWPSINCPVELAERLEEFEDVRANILGQASLNFTQDDVMFRKNEENSWLMQISGLHPEDELDFTHIHDSQVKIDLTRVISSCKPEKTESTDVTRRIILNDDIPVYQPARRLSYAEKQIVNKHIEEWLEQGIIRPCSSEYASPIVLVKKKNGDSRLCVDYCQLNRKLVKDRFPLPLIDDALDRLQEAKVYTTLDLKNGFFHVDVNEDCRKLTSFIIPDGQFEFNKVSFGLSTSPGVFQRYIYSIFWNLMNKGLIIIYMDDLIIPSADEEEGLRKLRTVFEVASKYWLEIQFKKYQFLKRNVAFLGHIVENEHSKIAKSLSDLLRKDNSFVFEQPQIEAFGKLKEILTSNPVLHIFKPRKKIELHTDASQQGYGTVLLQEADDMRRHPGTICPRKPTLLKKSTVVMR
ncbi:retrovirus-related Pol polyprotein from transposon gypsy [Trichonephila clavipes]|uniref:Retrovirus-related Pol polyprotein from transposon gypsy n=1 Tax=Trichonephila clavipes TaxID=2585209 RepID=A0A8X6RXY1_TRICX|nr:retrovirus-related Pol polyprotein from transposon gypsy [Trichonephila clavipes]